MSRPPKATMNELMGSAGSKKDFTLSDLPELLGDRTPEMEFSPRGRLRLVTALRNRFGESYRNLRGIGGLIKEFDKEAAFAVKLAQMRLIKGKK